MEFIDIVRVGKKRTAKRNDIAGPVAYGFRRKVWVIHSAGADYRHVDGFFHHLAVWDIQPLLLVHWRMIPPPCVIAADIDIKRVIAVLHQKFCRLDAFFDIAAFFFKLFARQSADAPVLNKALDAEAKGDREIRPARLCGFLPAPHAQSGACSPDCRRIRRCAG